MRIIIEKNIPYATVKDYLQRYLKLSSGMIATLKKRERGICLDGKPVTVRCPITPPCVLELATEDAEEDRNPFLAPEDIPLSFVYEDERIAVINKPPQMPTHPSLGHRSETLANGLAHHFERTRGGVFVFRAINRLDRDTSGLVLCAYDRVTAARYSGILADGGFQKIYLAVVCGEMHGCGCIEKPIRRARESILIRQTCALEDEGAEWAKTEYEVLATDGMISVLRVTPVTGRTHQIRVHLASVGHPILGDDLYGTPSPEMPRQALHAWRLTVTDGEEKESFCAPVPEDIRACIALHLPQFNREELL